MGNEYPKLYMQKCIENDEDAINLSNKQNPKKYKTIKIILTDYKTMKLIHTKH